MIENLNENTKELKDRKGENPEQVTKKIKTSFWPKKTYSAEAEVKKLRKQLQEKKDRISRMKKTEKELYRTIWKQDELIEQLKGGLEQVGVDVGNVICKMSGGC